LYSCGSLHDETVSHSGNCSGSISFIRSLPQSAVCMHCLSLLVARTLPVGVSCSTVLGRHTVSWVGHRGDSSSTPTYIRELNSLLPVDRLPLLRSSQQLIPTQQLVVLSACLLVHSLDSHGPLRCSGYYNFVLLMKLSPVSCTSSSLNTQASIFPC
jgi:hypothetical protein